MTDHLRPTVASIDLEQLRENLKRRGLIPHGRKFGGRKGDAYHGAIHCARTRGRWGLVRGCFGGGGRATSCGNQDADSVLVGQAQMVPMRRCAYSDATDW